MPAIGGVYQPPPQQQLTGRRLFNPPFHISSAVVNPVNMFADNAIVCNASLVRSWAPILSVSVGLSPKQLKSVGKRILFMPTVGIIPPWTEGNGVGLVPSFTAHAATVRQVLAANVIASGMLVNRAGKVMSATVNPLVGLTAVFFPGSATFSKSMSSTVACVVTFRRDMTKTISASLSSVASFPGNEVDKLISGIAALSAFDIGNQIGKILASDPVTATVTMLTPTTFLKAISAAVAAVASLTAFHAGVITSQAMSAAVACVGTVRKSAGKVMSASVTDTVTLFRRGVATTLFLRVPLVPALTKTMPFRLTAAVLAVASLSAHKGFVFTQSMVASVVRMVGSFKECFHVGLRPKSRGTLTITPEIPDVDIDVDPVDGCQES